MFETREESCEKCGFVNVWNDKNWLLLRQGSHQGPIWGLGTVLGTPKNNLTKPHFSQDSSCVSNMFLNKILLRQGSFRRRLKRSFFYKNLDPNGHFWLGTFLGTGTVLGTPGKFSGSSTEKYKSLEGQLEDAQRRVGALDTEKTTLESKLQSSLAELSEARDRI